MNCDKLYNSKSRKKAKKPRQITVVRPSKYDANEAVHTNKIYWKNIFQEIESSGNSTAGLDKKLDSHHLAQALPPELYEKVCDTLDIPATRYRQEEINTPPEQRARIVIKDPLLSYRTSLHVERDLDSDTDVEISPREDTKPEVNVHKELLQKPEREQITWPTRYLLPEREDEKNLVKKADDLTDRIAEDFCKYMNELGGNSPSQLLTTKAIKELFQIEFDTHVARSLKVVPKEMLSVDERIAIAAGYLQSSKYAVLEREITKDIAAEATQDQLIAFNRSLSLNDQWKAPMNDTKNMWRSARHVPKDLVSLKTVWEGITNLRSVKEYCRWMIEHPEYRRPPYLQSLGMFDQAVLEARLTFESQYQGLLSPNQTAPTETPSPIEHIRRRLSEVAET